MHAKRFSPSLLVGACVVAASMAISCEQRETGKVPNASEEAASKEWLPPEWLSWERQFREASMFASGPRTEENPLARERAQQNAIEQIKAAARLRPPAPGFDEAGTSEPSIPMTLSIPLKILRFSGTGAEGSYAICEPVKKNVAVVVHAATKSGHGYIATHSPFSKPSREPFVADERSLLNDRDTIIVTASDYGVDAFSQLDVGSIGIASVEAEGAGYVSKELHGSPDNPALGWASRTAFLLSGKVTKVEFLQP